MNWKTILAVVAIVLFTCTCNAQGTGDKDPQEAATEAVEEATEE
jgi:hypothetical protein